MGPVGWKRFSPGALLDPEYLQVLVVADGDPVRLCGSPLEEGVKGAEAGAVAGAGVKERAGVRKEQGKVRAGL